MGATAYQNAIDEAVANHSAHYEDQASKISPQDFELDTNN
jgi:hypothetical protein